MEQHKIICLDARKIDDGGIGTYIYSLINHFDFKDMKLILLMSSKGVEKYPDVKKRFKVIVCNASAYSVRAQVQLAWAIPKCDLFWSPHFNVPLLPIRARKRLVTIHDVFYLSKFNQCKWFERICAKVLINCAIKNSDHLITVSEFSRRELVELTNTSIDKISVMLLGVNRTHFSKVCDDKKIEEIREKYELPNRYFLFVGNRKAHKNLRGVCHALSDLITGGGKDYRLVIVGSEQGLRRVDHLGGLIDEYPHLKGRVKALGYVPHDVLPTLYQQAAGLIFPSFYEGFGLPPLEAMSARCPVIASSIPSIMEVCQNAVLYVNPNSSHDLAKAMRALWNEQSLRDQLIEKGSKHVKSFHWLGVAEKHREIMDMLTK